MTRRIVTPSFTRVDERGSFVEALNAGRWEVVICGRMKRDAVLGNHYHKKTEVFFFLTDGKAAVKTVGVYTQERDEFTLGAHEGVILPTGESHAIVFLEDSGFIMLKSVRYDPDDPDTFPYPVEPSP